MSSQTRIINAALVALGSGDMVSNINDGTRPARLAAAVWDEMVADMLACHPWNFAIRRATLNQVSGASAPDMTDLEYKYAWTVPSDCARWLPWAVDDPAHFEGEQEGAYILTASAGPISIRYIRRDATDPTKWPPAFVTAATFKLAERIAEGMTQSTSIARDMADKAEMELRRAKRQDGMASGRDDRGAVVSRSEWLSARNRTHFQIGR